MLDLVSKPLLVFCVDFSTDLVRVWVPGADPCDLCSRLMSVVFSSFGYSYVLFFF